MYQLPEELMESEILTRLPVQSLMRFKCVCKWWYALFQNPNFITAHAIFQHNNKSRLLVNGLKHGGHSVLSLLSGESLEPESYLDVGFLVDECGRNYEIRLVGSSSVNGIICMLLNTSKPIILNPATKELKVMPPSNLFGFRDAHQENITNYYEGYGFGYDTAKDDYTLVRIVMSDHCPYQEEEEVHDLCRFVEVYSLRSDCWRKLDIDINLSVDPFDYCCDVYSSTVLLNGMFHWVAKSLHNHNRLLLSIDMSSELLCTTHVPDLDKTEKMEEMVCLNGCIATITFGDNPFEGRWFNIWILGEIGVKESWTKHFTIGPSLEIKTPFGVGKNGEIFFLKNLPNRDDRKWWRQEVMAYYDITVPLSYWDPDFKLCSWSSREEVVYYDPRTQLFRSLGFKMCGVTAAMAIFSESLVPLGIKI